MARTKIAPTLQDVAAGRLIMPDMTKCPGALRELRALLAVVKATEEETATDRGCQLKPLRDRCPMCRALARLRSVSAGKRGAR